MFVILYSRYCCCEKLCNFSHFTVNLFFLFVSDDLLNWDTLLQLGSGQCKNIDGSMF